MMNLMKLTRLMKFTATLFIVALVWGVAGSAIAQTPQTPPAHTPSQRQPEQASRPAADPLAAALAEARRLINEGQAKAALDKLSSLPTQDDIRVVNLRGVAFYQIGDYTQAIGLLTQVWDNLPRNSTEQREAIEMLGMSHYLIGHIADSLPYFEQAMAWSSNNLDLNYVTGVAYIENKQPAKARESLARMFQIAPDSAAAHLITAQTMMRYKADDLAEAEFKRAAEKDPKLAGTNFWLGQLAIRREHYDQAVPLLERELVLNPSNSMVYYLLGDAYVRQSKWTEAVAPLKKAIWLEPYFNASYISLGKAYLNLKNFGQAEIVLKRAVQLDRGNKTAHQLLGEVYEKTGRAAEAKQEFSAAGASNNN